MTNENQNATNTHSEDLTVIEPQAAAPLESFEQSFPSSHKY